jgi:hypothetical protein
VGQAAGSASGRYLVQCLDRSATHWLLAGYFSHRQLSVTLLQRAA